VIIVMPVLPARAAAAAGLWFEARFESPFPSGTVKQLARYSSAVPISLC